MVMVLDLAATHAAEKFLRPIRTSVVEAVGFLMVDTLHLVSGMKLVPCAGLVGVDDGALGDASLYEVKGRAL